MLTIRRKTSEPGAKLATGLRHRETFQRNYLDQIINDGLIERTIPEKPTSRLQKYRLTEKGRRLLERLEKEGGGTPMKNIHSSSLTECRPVCHTP